MERVLIVHPYRHAGGVDTFVGNIVRCLSPKGFRFWVLMSGERPAAALYRELGAEVGIEPSLRTLPRTVSPARLVRYGRDTRRTRAAIERLIAQARLGIVHAVQETMWPVLIGLPGRRVRRIASVHGLRFLSPWLAGRANAGLVNAATDRIICVSGVVRAALRRCGVPEDKLALVPSSVDLDRYHQGVSGEAFRSELGVGREATLFGTVGSVDERKGLTYFLDACARVRQADASARFAIVGHSGASGPRAQVAYLAKLEARAQSLGLEPVLRFVPSRPDVPRVMAGLDVLVQPSLTEAGPRAPLEAMAMERPVVGTAVEGTAEEVVDGETGLLVPPRDADALANAMLLLARDPERRRQMGRAGRRRVEQHYSLATTAQLLAGVYTTATRVH